MSLINASVRLVKFITPIIKRAVLRKSYDKAEKDAHDGKVDELNDLFTKEQKK